MKSALAGHQMLVVKPWAWIQRLSYVHNMPFILSSTFLEEVQLWEQEGNFLEKALA